MKTKMYLIPLIFLFFNIPIIAQQSALYGSWKSTNGTITSFTKQVMIMAGESYTYQVSGNNIRVFDNYGNSMDYTYQVNGNTLYLGVTGVGTYTLTRVSNQNTTSNKTKQNSYNQNTISAGADRLYGSFCSYSSSGYSGSSSYSTTNRVTFDGRGHYTYGSQSSYSGSNGSYNGGDGGYSGTYKVVGNKGVILTDTDGSQYRVLIYFIQDSGQITELKYDGVVYAKSLCD